MINLLYKEPGPDPEPILGILLKENQESDIIIISIFGSALPLIEAGLSPLNYRAKYNKQSQRSLAWLLSTFLCF
jgi:hypothetical protein